MDIKLYNFEFELLCVENRFTSLNSEIYYCDVGKVEIHLPLSSSLLPYVIGTDDYHVIKYGKNTAIVTGFTVINELVIYGRTCNWLFGKRTLPAFSLENPVEGISLGSGIEDTARSLASYAFSDVDNFVLAPPCGIKNDTAFWRNTRNVALDVMKDCLALAGGGFRLDFDVSRKVWEFVTLKGKLRDYVISEAHKNAYDVEYSRDILDLLTCGYYTEQEDESEKYVSSMEKSGIYRFEGILSATGESEALTELSKASVNDIVKAKFRTLSYGKDYDLGDIVRIRIDKGDYRKTVRRRCIGIKQNYDEDGYSEQPVLEEETEEII